MYLTYLLSQDKPVKDTTCTCTYREVFRFFGIVSKKVEDRQEKGKRKGKEVGRLGS